MRVLKSLTVLVSFWAVILFPRTFALSDDIAVVVGSEVILKSDVDEKVVLLKKFLDPTSVASVSDYDFRKKTVDTLIDTQLQINFAKKLGIELTPQEKTLAVDQFLMHQKSDRKTFEKNLRNEGIRPSLLYSSLQQQYLMQKLQQLVVSPQVMVSKSKLEEFRKDLVNKSAQYFVEDIVFSQVDTKAAKDRSFSKAKDLAKQWSVRTYNRYNVPKSSKMIQFKWMLFDDFPDMFQGQVLKMKQGQVSDPLVSENGIHVLKLIKKRFSKKVPSDEKLKESLFGDAFLEKVKDWVGELRSQQYIKVFDK